MYQIVFYATNVNVGYIHGMRVSTLLYRASLEGFDGFEPDQGIGIGIMSQSSEKKRYPVPYHVHNRSHKTGGLFECGWITGKK